MLKSIQGYFGGIGSLSVNKDTVFWRVRSIEQLMVIVRHFDRYTLITKKRIDYFLFKAAMQLIINKEHLTEKGLVKLANIRASINKGLPDTLKEAFSDIKPIELPTSLTDFTIQPKDINPYWVAGFTEAEGCFFVTIQENPETFQVKLGYQVSQNNRDLYLIKSLKVFFECGRTEPAGKSAMSFRVTKIKDNLDKIIPFFEKYPLLGSKSKDFKDWVEVSKLMASKAHLTPEGRILIKKIKNCMNSLRIPE